MNGTQLRVEQEIEKFLGQIKGDGLGLYFAHGLITKHGGRMWAESEGRGRGSTFCFTLPLTQDGVDRGSQP